MKTFLSMLMWMSFLMGEVVTFDDSLTHTKRNVYIWLPGQAVKPAVIVLSHGFTGNITQLQWLRDSLLNSGFAVVEVQHLDRLNGQINLNIGKRAEDITLALDAVSNSEYAEKLDLNRIGFAGYSMGGSTGLWLAGGKTDFAAIKAKLEGQFPDSFLINTFQSVNSGEFEKDRRDKRIKALFLMAPAWPWLFTEHSLKSISIPVYIVAGTGDTVLNIQDNAMEFARLIPHATFNKVEGSHNIFMRDFKEVSGQAIKFFKEIFSLTHS